MFEHVILEPEQEDLLVKLVEAARNTPKERREKFLLIKTMGSTRLHHPGLKGKDKAVYEGDLEVLAATGLLNPSYGSRGTSLFDVSPLGFRFYEFYKAKLGEPLEKIESSITHYLEGAEFIEKYPKAYKKWSEAEALLWSTDSEKQLTTIGHLCREAAQEFAAALVVRYKPQDVEKDVSKTVSRVRAVLDQNGQALGTTVKPLLDALLVFWGTTSDLIQRQEHGGQKEGQPLVWEDGRRVVFSTAVVMAELDRALV